MYENKRIEPTNNISSTSNIPDYLSNPVHGIIEQHAKETPNAIAIRSGDQEITYAELNQAANQLAKFLSEKQIGSEDRIAVCFEPSANILISLLGILKAGAVYVPLDPTYPQGRIQTILNEIKPSFVLTERYLSERLSLNDHPLIYLDTLPAYTEEQNLSCIPDVNQTAYIFFTSGSTGTPKGVMATYKNLRQFTRVAIDRYKMNHTTVMPTIARFSFSISLFELLCPLVAGGTVVVLDRAHVFDLAKMAETLSKVTIFHAGPSFLKNFLPYIQNKKDQSFSFAGVQHASSGGDMIPPDMLESLKSIFPNAEVFVIYGSTEIACMGCTFPVPRDQQITKTYVGRPFPNTKVRIVDEHFVEVPQGMEGEVCFSGAGVSKGYLDKPKLTQDKFINLDGHIYYRMGDLGRINEQGELQLLGRIDFQIKIRGMRVELGEVEYLLRKAPGVRDGVVAGRDLGNGEKNLIAYVVFSDQHNKDLSAINAHLSYHLPDYMIPSGYVELAELPLNLNMKLDRNALPDSIDLIQHPHSNRSIRIPETPTQIQLASLLKNLLKVKEIGLDDNFFDLGGHSALAIELMVKIDETFGVTVESLDVLRETVEVLAQIIEQRLGNITCTTNQTPYEQSSTIHLESFFFGQDDSLYGVFHRPIGDLKKVVLVCSPTPYEDARLDFIINRLARRLVKNNIGLMQFHYFGTKDSAGDGAIESILRWKDDILMAHKEIQRRSQNTKVVGLGIRLGATLLWNAQEDINCERMVFWDPILDGTQYYQDLENQHRLLVTNSMPTRNGRRTHKNPEQLELLGTNYSITAMDELKTITFSLTQHKTPVFWFASTEIDKQYSSFERLKNGHNNATFQSNVLDPQLFWLKSTDIIPDTGLSKILAEMVDFI